MTPVCCCLAFAITPSQSPPPPTADRLPPPPSPPPALLNDFDFSKEFATANFSGAVRGVVVLQRGLAYGLLAGLRPHEHKLVVPCDGGHPCRLPSSPTRTAWPR